MQDILLGKFLSRLHFIILNYRTCLRQHLSNFFKYNIYTANQKLDRNILCVFLKSLFFATLWRHYKVFQS